MKQTLFKATMLLLAIITTASAWAGNIPRPDVNAAYNITGNHGFQTFIPIDDVGTKYVRVYAIDGRATAIP